MQKEKYKALLFDLNGTMIDDMHYHITAWHRILNELGSNISLEQMKEECYGKNHELLERMFPGRFSNEEKDRMSYQKEKQYQDQFRPELKLIDGLYDLLKKAHQKKIKTAIGSAAIMFNVDFILDELNIRKYINVIVSADNVSHSKPHPETFLKCAEELSVAPEDCLVIEDSIKGAEAAMNAGMNCIIVTTSHAPDEFAQSKNVIGFIKNYNDDLIKQLI